MVETNKNINAILLNPAHHPLYRYGISQTLETQWPIIQAGMVWVSGAKLAAASARSGCLGLIGAGSMTPDLLRQHIRKAFSLMGEPSSKAKDVKPRLGVNIPLLYSKIEEQLAICLEEGVEVFFTSAGSPKKHTKFLKDNGAKVVVHVTSSAELAKKCEDAGCDAVVAEGFEAGGHNGRDETTTMVLIPQVVDAVKIPVIAAGGIADARQMAAAFCLGASGVQIGSRFAATQESSAHENFKNKIIEATASSTELVMKSVVPVRLLKNKFYHEIKEAENSAASPERLKEILGKGRAKRGMLEGDTDQGELEIGQVAAMIKDLPQVSDLVRNLLMSYLHVQKP